MLLAIALSGAVSPADARKTKPVATTPPPPPPPPSTGAITTWRPVGSAPLSDADAAARVSLSAETRPANGAANAYRPTAAELDLFRNGQRDSYNRTQLMYNRLAAYVTGNYSGTTDQILQWVAQKWGIPEDIVRAVAANESWWNMSQLGDLQTVTDPASYPAFSRVGTTNDVYQSLGIMQIKWTPQGRHQGTEPLRWKSTAFNADYWGSVVRYYYDGLCDWCGTTATTGYSAGQDWNSIGAWYNPSPWSTGSTTYQTNVKSRQSQRVWAQAGF
jgi:autotransporter family porin